MDRCPALAEPIIHRLPPSQLAPPFGAARRIRDLRDVDVREILRAGPVRFVVAEILTPLRCVPENDCFRFWESEVWPHLVADPDEGANFDNFPDNYCYFASEWSDGHTPIVLLSTAH